MERLDGKKIIITGGTSGMGEGVVRAFPALGRRRKNRSGNWRYFCEGRRC